MQTKAQVHLDRDSTPLFRQTAEILRERILSGEYPPESILPSERELSESLGVSRVPVREAIKALEYVGIVKQERGRGVVVQRADPGAVFSKIGPFLAPLSVESILDLFDLRILIESYSAGLAARRATEADVRELRGYVEASNAADIDVDARESAWAQFHRKVIAIGGNRMIQIVNSFFAEVQRYSFHLTLSTEARRRESIAFHGRICEAIAAHDEERAASLMREHLEGAKAELVREQKARGWKDSRESLK
ncbi:FadR family transcriptional regulator [Mesosutterella sp. OilRF-GAM-744-9]|uniref:FadR family transcriptional regulator n=1 Tax=Mesosutterella porci TaxID=2915351 RepID=A0ABS9MNA7_9BURK|nr:FadR/GntR family transcriptional regulator [Mesosutterella sp. oilRF-744-WT-GAM-9]MCG5030017.1 FadR family transcriptional regulator [Mesosutterella sp. oilRF-744-WT-GAM-9]